jgi:hypothetical protein
MVLTRRRLTTATATTPYKPLDEATPAKALLDATNLRKNAPATAPVQRKNVAAPVTAPAQVDGPARRTRSTRKMAPSRKESPVCLTKKDVTSVRRPRKNETEVVAPAAEEPVAPAAEEPVAPARPPAKTVTKPKKNVTFAAPPPPAQIYVRKRDAVAVFIVAVVAAAAGHYFGTLANAPPDVAAIAEYVQEAPLFETTADLLGDALARARLATSVLRECLE